MSTMNVRKVVFNDHPDAVFITLIAVSAFASLSLTPTFPSVFLTLSLLLIYSRILFTSQHALRSSSILCVAIALASSLARIRPSLHALSSPGVSLVVLFASSLVTSAIIIVAAFIDTRSSTRLPSPWSQVAFFPALWTTLWMAVSGVSPIGRLSVWSPADAGVYEWMIPLLGYQSIDWAVAAWAVIFYQVIGMWYMGSEPEEPLINASDSTAPGPSSASPRSTGYLAILLTVLAIPSFFIQNVPLPVQPLDQTPIGVACVLPPFQRYKHHSLTLDDYIAETQKLTSAAKLLLWPEGAVAFSTQEEKTKAMERIHKTVAASKSYVGVSFEEVYDSPNSTSGRTSSRRTGLALISRYSDEPHFVYYKRHLVPIAESFSQSSSDAPPSIFNLELEHPYDVNKTAWAPGPSHTRSVPITASICLDLSDPMQFHSLETKPAVILAPARTWDTAIGIAMWNQAKQRAEEQGSMVLWCDGGDGGVSGVTGGGYREFYQIGRGSWARTIGISYPFDDGRTLYAFLGNYSLVLFWALLFMTTVSLRLVHFHGYMPRPLLNVAKLGLQRFRKALSRNNSSDAQPNLL